MKYFQLLIIVAVAAAMSSCATVLTGTTQRVTIDSTPKGADIIIDGRMMGTTPATVRLDRDLNALIDNGKFVELQLPGYAADGYYLGVNIEPTFILNVFCPVGFALDAVTGALMKYDSNYYNFRMVPAQGNAVSNQGQGNMVQDASSEDDYEKLMKLVEMYEDGLLTEAEFEAEKAKIFEDKRN